jgi:hypothetical protein
MALDPQKRTYGVGLLAKAVVNSSVIYIESFNRSVAAIDSVSGKTRFSTAGMSFDIVTI